MEHNVSTIYSMKQKKNTKAYEILSNTKVIALHFELYYKTIINLNKRYNLIDREKLPASYWTRKQTRFILGR